MDAKKAFEKTKQIEISQAQKIFNLVIQNCQKQINSSINSGKYSTLCYGHDSYTMDKKSIKYFTDLGYTVTTPKKYLAYFGYYDEDDYNDYEYSHHSADHRYRPVTQVSWENKTEKETVKKVWYSMT